MSIQYVIRRFLFAVMIVLVASALLFFVQRLSPKNPVRERLMQRAISSGFVQENADQLVASYNERFGLDRPLIEQYFRYMGNLLRGDLGPSLFSFPTTVLEIIQNALPWTIALYLSALLISAIFGSLLGALAAWPRSPGWVKGILTPLMTISGIPGYVFGILLIYLMAYQLRVVTGTQIFPYGGGRSPGVAVGFTPEFIINAIWHQILPATALILPSLGGWALGMRGMGVTVQGEDYVNFAEHKGLSDRRIFGSYYVRNAMLPQFTGLGLSLGSVVVSGSLVEGLFGLPGLGGVLGQAILVSDFPTINGVCLFIVIGIALAMFVIDLVNPLIDPRIRAR
jgi:peptide/nickel transport system permease protein